MTNLNTSKEFWSKRFRKYGKLSTGYTDEMIYKFDDKIRWNSFMHETNLKKGDVILDAGCNHGSWSIRLAKNGMEVTGIDLISAAIETAKKVAEKESIQIEFKEMKLEDIDFKENKFNKIVSITVMQHLLDDNLFLTTLKKFKKQLKNEGELILIESAANKQLVEKLSYKRERSLKKHINLCNRAGFKLIKIRGISHLSVRWYYGIEHFFSSKKAKRIIQYIGLVILNPIDIFLARFKLFSKYSNLKLMIFNKI
tara:strand:- start:288 stop:1049 length:762 start_codon:yes stop_codon:yes gene_type:complete